MFKPLVGTLDGGVTTGSVWPEEDATTTADEVDASLVEGGAYAGGPGRTSESGAPCGPEQLSAVLTTQVRHRETYVFRESLLLIAGTLGLVVKDHFQGN
jgi:hypothetical protein